MLYGLPILVCQTHFDNGAFRLSLRIEPVERPSVTIAYWIIGGVLVAAGLFTLPGMRGIDSLAAILDAGENLLIAGMLFLMGGLCLYGAWVMTRDRLRRGAAVRFRRTPARPGDTACVSASTAAAAVPA